MTSNHTIKVKDNPTLVRDSYSKAIINTDVSAYNAVCHRRNMQLKHENTIADLYSQIEELNNQIDNLLEWKESVIEQLSNLEPTSKKIKTKANII